MMGKRIGQWVLLGLVALAVSACTHAEIGRKFDPAPVYKGELGRKFDTAAASRIALGWTTEAQVLAALGEPLHKMVLSDGRKIYSYNYIQTQVYADRGGMKGSGQGEQLTVGFDKNGIVRSIIRGSSPVGGGPGTGD